jgi:ABC-2 type transport system permease protein
MSTSSMIAHQARYDLMVYSRDPRARGFTLALPVLLFALFGYLFRHDTFTYSHGVTISGDTYYLPRMITLGLVGTTLSNLVIVLVSKRETGALKRRRATPIRAFVLIAGDIITSEVSAIVIGIVLVALGALAFSVPLTAAGIGALVLIVVVATAAFCGLAYGVSTLINSVDSAAPLVTLIMFALNAISGIYVPESLFPAWLRDTAQVLPVRPLATAMQAAISPVTNGGHAYNWASLLIVLAWGAAGTLFALRRFSWSPSRG